MRRHTWPPRRDDERSSDAAPLALVPFIVPSVLAWATIPIGTEIDWTLYWLSLLAALTGGALLVLDWPPTPYFSVALRSGLVLLGIALLRESAGGSTAGVAVMSLLPVFYTALYRRSRVDLVIVLGEVAIFYLAPILLIGPPEYPTSQYRAALLAISVGTIMGFTTRGS